MHPTNSTPVFDNYFNAAKTITHTLTNSSILESHNKIVNGFPISVIEEFSKEMEIPKETLISYLEIDASAATVEGESANWLVLLSQALCAAMEQFSHDKAKVLKWLSTPQSSFKNNSPLNLLKCHISSQIVFVSLTKMN